MLKKFDLVWSEEDMNVDIGLDIFEVEPDGL